MEVEVGDWFCNDLFGKNSYGRINDVDKKGNYLIIYRDGSGDYNNNDKTISYFLRKWTHVRNFELMDILYGEE